MSMPLRTELKQSAKDQLKSNFGNAILVVLIYGAIVYATLSCGILLIIGGPLYLGVVIFFINLKRNNDPKIDDMFKGFNNFGNSLVTYLLMTLFILLWSLLLFIPGIIKAISYSQAFYILNDNPEMSGLDAINKSKEMMKGHLGEYFVLSLSFIGWHLLSMLTCGILSIVYVGPYMSLTFANYYDALKADFENNPSV